jgi:hypothetical protein
MRKADDIENVILETILTSNLGTATSLERVDTAPGFTKLFRNQ